MFSSDNSNHHFQLAARFINQTGQSVFLTGKAGSGKTTFLKYIKENTFKKTVVVAPTGVAAINAGGVTMHSFFQLPFGPFIPAGQNDTGNNSNSSNEHSLLRNLRFNIDKRELLRELELLIIDEVSMVRSDMLDAVDTILRHYRNKLHQPFGGVQVLLIGDLFQLPPIVPDSEWEMLKQFYRSPFFFDALALQHQPPVFIELKKIYRQNEADFINLLNNIRNNIAGKEDLELLHRHYKPGFEPAPEEHYITLCTHNNSADLINNSRLSKLPGQPSIFRGELTGEFSEKALPAEMELRLKAGAQIMFIKNDKGEARRFYNGRIATINRVEADKIFIGFPDGSPEMQLEKETWRNIRYHYNKEKDEVEEEELGSYTQYPLRLAWAITIHKSQGLTFEKAIVDAGASFAPGQVYVALSRLTSMDGLVLYSRIHPQSIKTDLRVITFSENEIQFHELESQLVTGQKDFISQSLIKTFDWQKLVDEMDLFMEEFGHRMIPDKNVAMRWAGKMQSEVQEQKDVAEKFVRQLQQLVAVAGQEGYSQLHERMQAAVGYFLKPVDEMIASAREHQAAYKVKLKVKKYMRDLNDLIISLERKKQELQHALVISEGLAKGTDTNDLLDKVVERGEPIAVENVRALPKPKKGDSKLLSLEMFREGKSVEEIAKLRGLVSGTILGHLVDFISSGEVKITQLLSEEKIAAINKVIDETGEAPGSVYREKLGPDFSYSEIKAVMNWKTLVPAG